MSTVHERLDQFKLLIAIEILQHVDLPTIRAASLCNLKRWNVGGGRNCPYEKWRDLMTSGTDQEVIVAMTGLDHVSNRLRQFPPYTGLIKEKARWAILRGLGYTGPVE